MQPGAGLSMFYVLCFITGAAFFFSVSFLSSPTRPVSDSEQFDMDKSGVMSIRSFMLRYTCL